MYFVIRAPVVFECIFAVVPYIRIPFHMPVDKFVDYGLLSKPCWVKVLPSFSLLYIFRDLDTVSVNKQGKKKKKSMPWRLPS